MKNKEIIELKLEEEIFKKVKKNKKYNKILLVTHGGVSRAIEWYFNGIPKNGKFLPVIENCKIYEYSL